MPTRKYSARELLCVSRTPEWGESSDVQAKLRARLRNNSDIGACQPLRGFNNRALTHPGDIVRPANRKLPRIQEEAFEAVDDLGRRISDKKIASSQLDGTEWEWKYRGRTSSKEADPHPISAPSGVFAQRDEGFQRFYKAVVSPTHVRVTAGGRIVPNPRGSVSPTTKWAKSIAEEEPSAFKPAFLAPQFHYPPPAGFPTFLPTHMYPAFPPPFSHGVPPYAMVPWPMMTPMGPAFAVPETSPGKHRTDKVKEPLRPERQSESSISERPYGPQTPASERWEPRFAPYYGHPSVPISSTRSQPGTTTAPSHSSSAQAGQHDLSQDAQPKSRRGVLRSDHRSEEGLATTTSPAAHLSHRSQPQHASSIKMSEITKNQIPGLRKQLKWAEDQLQYNKHQIDEAKMQALVDQLSENIRHLEESILPLQLADEARFYNAAPRENAEAFKSPSSRKEKKSSARWSSDINSTKRQPSALVNIAETPAKVDQPNRSSSLPAGAALAAPFQPRSDEAVTSTTSSQHNYMGSGYRWPLQYSVPLDQMKAAGYTGWEDLPPYPPQTPINTQVPYLIGYLPQGVNPEYAKETDYIYERELTDDERRARLLYWGKASRTLRAGLPKYDGKDFYPPSPVRDQSFDEALEREATTEHSNVPNKAAQSSDPFQGLAPKGKLAARNGAGHSTQSEALPGKGTESGTSTPKHSRPDLRQVFRSLDEPSKLSIASTTTPKGAKDKSTSGEEDDKEIVFAGRRALSQTRYVSTSSSQLQIH